MSKIDPPRQPLTDYYAVFTGLIDSVSIPRFTQALLNLSDPERNMGRLHILIQSNGGIVGDGVFLYNLFKNYPLPLTLYNGGTIASIAVIAFLGAKERKASARATFMIHRTKFTPQSAFAAGLKSFANAAPIEDARTESILREHVALPPDKWTALNANTDVLIAAEESVEYGFATEIGEFSPPPGTQLYTI